MSALRLIPFLEQYNIFLKKNGPTPASFSFIFGLFKQTSLQFLQQIYVKKCPSSICYRDLNPRPLEFESLPTTTRPGLPPDIIFLLLPLRQYYLGSCDITFGALTAHACV